MRHKSNNDYLLLQANIIRLLLFGRRVVDYTSPDLVPIGAAAAVATA
jgi:hypothetical protein